MIKNKSEVLSFSYLLIVLFLSVLILILSFSFEYFGNTKACLFCNLQRLIYILIAILSFLGIVVSSFKKYAFRSVVIILSIGIIISTCHVLIQYGVLKDPCKIAPQITDINSFENLIFHSPIPCSKISWSLFGISISIYNIGLYLCLFILTLTNKSLFFAKKKSRLN